MLLMRFPGGKKKAFTLGYDDGLLYDRRMVQILNKHRIKCTFFPILTNYKTEGEDGCITPDEAKALYDGHEIGSHTIAHGYMGYTHACESMRDIVEDKTKGELLFERIITGFGYPNGCYNEETKEILKNAGYQYARNSQSSHNYKLPKDWMEWQATCTHNDPELMEFAKNFVESKKTWGSVDVFYVRGHSYEFDRDNNWEILENLCEYMKDREDIWYATNGEIRRQVKIFENLEISMDGKRIYNPSADSVWVETENFGKIMEIRGGETVIL